MTIPARDIDGVFKARPLEWNFECTYNTWYAVTADEMLMDASANTGEFAATGEFDLQIRKVTYRNHKFKLNLIFCL